MRLRLVLLVVLAGLGASVRAQPTPERLLADWQRGWHDAASRVGALTFTEEADRHVEGPRARQHLRTLTDVRFDPDGGLDRDLRRATFNGEPVPPARLRLMERRMERAYGPGFVWVRTPLFVPIRVLRLLDAVGPATADRLDGIPAWRIEAQPGTGNDRIERATLWFAQTGPRERPRLLRMHLVGAAPRGGSALVTTDFTAVLGLDLPRRTHAEVVVPQRRRERVFTTLLTADVRYDGYTAAPR